MTIPGNSTSNTILSPQVAILCINAKCKSATNCGIKQRQHTFRKNCANFPSIVIERICRSNVIVKTFHIWEISIVVREFLQFSLQILPKQLLNITAKEQKQPKLKHLRGKVTWERQLQNRIRIQLHSSRKVQTVNVKRLYPEGRGRI